MENGFLTTRREMGNVEDPLQVNTFFAPNSSPKTHLHIDTLDDLHRSDNSIQDRRTFWWKEHTRSALRTRVGLPLSEMRSRKAITMSGWDASERGA